MQGCYFKVKTNSATFHFKNIPQPRPPNFLRKFSASK